MAGMLAAALCAQARSQDIPARIVSTAPSTTEALFALGLGSNVVGVSIYCEYPPEAKALPKVGTYVQPDMEAIVRLRPDLVVLQKHEGPMPERLRSLGIRFVEVPYGSLADVFTGIVLLAQAAGVPQRGAALDAQIRHGLDAVRKKAAALPRVRTLVIVDRGAGSLTGLIAVGPGNYVNDLIEIAGGLNLLAKPGLPMYPRISLETVLRADPQVIVDLTDSHEADAAHAFVAADDRALWARHPELAAVRAGRVAMGTSAALLVPGPRSPQAARIFFDFFHGGGR